MECTANCLAETRARLQGESVITRSGIYAITTRKRDHHCTAFLSLGDLACSRMMIVICSFMHYFILKEFRGNSEVFLFFSSEQEGIKRCFAAAVVDDDTMMLTFFLLLVIQNTPQSFKTKANSTEVPESAALRKQHVQER